MRDEKFDEKDREKAGKSPQEKSWEKYRRDQSAQCLGRHFDMGGLVLLASLGI
jgi:hypothetical protein